MSWNSSLCVCVELRMCVYCIEICNDSIGFSELRELDCNSWQRCSAFLSLLCMQPCYGKRRETLYVWYTLYTPVKFVNQCSYSSNVLGKCWLCEHQHWEKKHNLPHVLLAAAGVERALLKIVAKGDLQCFARKREECVCCPLLTHTYPLLTYIHACIFLFWHTHIQVSLASSTHKCTSLLSSSSKPLHKVFLSFGFGDSKRALSFAYSAGTCSQVQASPFIHPYMHCESVVCSMVLWCIGDLVHMRQCFHGLHDCVFTTIVTGSIVCRLWERVLLYV